MCYHLVRTYFVTHRFADSTTMQTNSERNAISVRVWLCESRKNDCTWYCKHQMKYLWSLIIFTNYYFELQQYIFHCNTIHVVTADYTAETMHWRQQRPLATVESSETMHWRLQRPLKSTETSVHWRLQRPLEISETTGDSRDYIHFNKMFVILTIPFVI